MEGRRRAWGEWGGEVVPAEDAGGCGGGWRGGVVEVEVEVEVKGWEGEEWRGGEGRWGGGVESRGKGWRGVGGFRLFKAGLAARGR